MDFRFSDEQNTIRDLARGIFEQEVTPERLKAAEATPDRIDDALWKTLAEANLLGIAVPEAQGGMGLGLLELCTLLEEWGRAVAPVPAFAALLLGGLPVARFGNEAQRAQWLPGLASGAHLLTAALQDAGSEDPAAPATTARRDGTDFLLSGAKRLVPAASRAARILVPAATGDGVAFFLVDPSASGVRVTPQRTSIKEPLFDLVLEGVRVARSDVFGDAAAARWLRDAALVALCTTQVGVSERALEITAKYVRERVQFGVPIGSFQALKHRAAKVFMEIELARSATMAAARAIDASADDAARLVSLAKARCSDAFVLAANEGVQMFGGVGMTDEYDVGFYIKRARAAEMTFGDAAWHRERWARLGGY